MSRRYSFSWEIYNIHVFHATIMILYEVQEEGE
jgi:hypothetical protein